MVDRNELAKLVTFIEENLRSSPSVGLQFLDSRHHRSRLTSKQNHVVYGRRGAGKTSLLSSLRESNMQVVVYISLEDFKDITFPNIIVRVLVELFDALKVRLKERWPWYKLNLKAIKLSRDLSQTIDALQEFLHQPDKEVQLVKTTEHTDESVKAGVGHLPASASAESSHGHSREVRRKLPSIKLDYLRIELANYKKLLARISTAFGGLPLFLTLDDYYFVRKETQPDLIDYFHRLTKGTDLFFKMATIKHRSKLYRRERDQYFGVERGHDAFEIDMDYMLDDFDILQQFMRQLLTSAVEKSGASVAIDALFAG